MSWEYFVLPIILFGLSLISIEFLHKGFTYGKSDRKYVYNWNPFNGHILDELLALSSILPFPLARIIHFVVGSIMLLTSVLLNYLFYSTFFPIPTWLAVIIVAVVTIVSVPLGIKLRKEVYPSDEAIEKRFQQVLSVPSIRSLYENQDYTFLFHKNEAIRSWLLNINLKKLQQDRAYLQKIEKLVTERLCTPPEERKIDDHENRI